MVGEVTFLWFGVGIGLTLVVGSVIGMLLTLRSATAAIAEDTERKLREDAAHRSIEMQRERAVHA